MIRFKDISIPKPCTADYDELPGDEVKRFCGSCKKHVYDFRGKDEAYLNEVFQKTGKVCGIYYENQIQKPSLRIQRRFYNGFVTKIIGIGLFIKTLFSSYDTDAKTPNPFQTIQVSEDSVGIEVKDKNKSNRKRHPYTISIFINNKLYRSNIYDEVNFIYLPDSIKADDKIKVIVKPDGTGKKWTNEIIKTKTYRFKYKKSEKIRINIVYKKPIQLIKRRHLMGVPNDFW